jgi:prepilin-type N-terminal cleavage/methylation domain-containing protein
MAPPPDPCPPAHRPIGGTGFTLVELLVAMVITSLVLLLAARLFAGLTFAAQQVEFSRSTLDRRMNARRWLTVTLLNLEVGTTGAHPFEGHPDQVTFTSWRPVAVGWLERGTAHLGLSSGEFRLESDGMDPVVLADSVADVGFDYLLEPGVDTRWVREWLSPVSAPLAVRLRITSAIPGIPVDTILLLIKERG